MKNFEEGPKTPKNLLQKLQERGPNRNPLFTAVEELEDEAQIQEFFKQYVESLEGSVKGTPKAIAEKRIGHVIGYHDEETANRWMKALPNIIYAIYPEQRQGKKK